MRASLKYVFSFEENIEIFAYCFFPEYASNKFAKFHKEILEFMNTPGNGAVGAPRGHGKSTLIGLFWLLWVIVNNKKKYIVYISENHNKTVKFLDPIRNELKNNSFLRFVYKLDIRANKDDEGKDREDCYDIAGCRIEAASFNTNVRGFKHFHMRPDLIIGDDIESDERVINPELRKKDFFTLNKIIIPSLDINGEFKYVGTILNLNSLLLGKIRQYGGKIYEACDEDVSPASILWDERFTQDKLLAIKADIGSVSFESEYRNNPIDNTAALIKGEWMRDCCDEQLSYGEDGKYDIKVQGVDFAFSDRIVADKSAFVGIGKTEESYTVLQCFTKKGMSITEQFDYIEYLSGMYGFDHNALEENSIRSMSKELKNYTFEYTLFWTAATDGAAKQKYDNDYDNKRHTIGKTAMIKRLATQFENRRIILPYKTEKDKATTDQIIAECSTYALNDGKLVETGVHGDIPIALAYAIEYCEIEKFEFIGGMLE